MHILVTGGTGTLGRQVVNQLSSGDHTVSVLTRRKALPAGLGACDIRTADLVTGEGVAAALSGVDSVIHCASNPTDLRARADLQGTSNLIAAAKGAQSPHLTYISIVGVDQIPVPYYKAKYRAERLVEHSGLPYAILRATQFHDLLWQVLKACSKPPVAIVPKGFQFQPVNSGEVAAKLIALTAQQHTGRSPDFGGPQKADIADWMRLYLGTAGRSKRLLEVPVAGKIGSGFRAGKNTTVAGERGSATFAEYLATATG